MHGMAVQPGCDIGAAFVGQDSKIHHMGMSAIQNLQKKFFRIPAKLQCPGQIIAGTGGNISDTYLAKVLNSLQASLTVPSPPSMSRLTGRLAAVICRVSSVTCPL